LDSNAEFRIEKNKEHLDSSQVNPEDRHIVVEESRERFDRYKWAISLFPALDGKNERSEILG
jgi:hypothetical protein